MKPPQLLAFRDIPEHFRRNTLKIFIAVGGH